MGLYLPGALRKRLVAESKRSKLKLSTVVQIALDAHLTRSEIKTSIKGK